MHPRTILLLALAATLSPAQPFAGVPPLSDRLEPITGAIQTVTSVELRAAAVTLIAHATDFYALHAKTSPPHVLQIAFDATASTLFPAGTGQLRETWISGQNWRWDATLGAYSLLRISSNGVAWDADDPKPIPLRLKMLANAVFAPLQFATPRISTMRTATATRNGVALTCILLSPQGSAAGTPNSRGWNESEFCIDPSSGLLNVYSEAPGLYVFYDYANALKFHDKILPGAVTVNENDQAVIQARLTSIADADPSAMAPYIPTSQMKEHGPAVILYSPMRILRIISAPTPSSGGVAEPVIVHVTLDEQGKVQESETLQTSRLSARALSLVSQERFAPVSRSDGTAPRQREAFVTVDFVGNQRP